MLALIVVGTGLGVYVLVALILNWDHPVIAPRRHDGGTLTPSHDRWIGPSSPERSRTGLAGDK